VVNCWVGFDVASGLTDGKLSQPNIVHAHPIIARPRHKNGPLESGI